MKMKNLILSTLLSLTFIFSSSSTLQAVVAPLANTEKTESILDLSATDIAQLDHQAIEKKMGRSLKWKEKIALKWAKRKAKKTAAKQHRKNTHEGGTDALAIAGFVLGVMGLLYWGFVLGLLGVIFSAIALRRIKRNPGLGGRGLAIAGLVTGIVALFLWSAIIAIAIAL